MNIATIEDLAYLMQQAKDEKTAKPIVFLGAGVSKTGGVPLAGEIVDDILRKYCKNPKIKNVKDEDKSYAKLMALLTPSDRNKLLKDYIDKAKINVSHIYLAQLIVNGYVDYVLTVNFDNLMLKALALYNEFPPTYDMAILKDLTTTSFKEKSVVYLHGQHHGLWLLNTAEEMAKVDTMIPRILDSIKSDRAWIFIGYSGEDPIFGHIKELATRFDNGLFWVTYKDNNPSEAVCKGLLEREHMNAHVIKGYDSDSFMLKLNTVLNLDQPQIIDIPFSSLKKTLESIVDINEKEHYKDVKERLEIAKKNVSNAIARYEKGEVKSDANTREEIDIDLLKKQIIDKIVSGSIDKDEIENIDKRAREVNDVKINELMASLYNSYAMNIAANARVTGKENLFAQCFENYIRAMEFNPNDYIVFYNWGNAISFLAKMKNEENLYLESFKIYQNAVKLNPNDDKLFNNWAIAISDLANLKNDEGLYLECFGKYRIATELNSQNDAAYYNWGNAISDLAKLKNDEGWYLESFEKYKRAAELNSKNESTFYNWGTALLDLATMKKDDNLYQQSIEKLKKAIDLGASSYNLACLYAIRNDKVNAFAILEISLTKKEIAVDFVEKDEDWKLFWDDENFKALLAKYR